MDKSYHGVRRRSFVVNYDSAYSISYGKKLHLEMEGKHVFKYTNRRSFGITFNIRSR